MDLQVHGFVYIFLAVTSNEDTKLQTLVVLYSLMWFIFYVNYMAKHSWTPDHAGFPQTVSTQLEVHNCLEYRVTFVTLQVPYIGAKEPRQVPT